MKCYPMLLLFSLLSLTTMSAQADIIDDAIGNVQQAINDAYKPDNGWDYDDSRGENWQHQMSDGRRRQYDNCRRQFEDRRHQLDSHQHQLDQGQRQLEDGERRMEEDYDR